MKTSNIQFYGTILSFMKMWYNIEFKLDSIFYDLVFFITEVVPLRFFSKKLRFFKLSKRIFFGAIYPGFR